MLTLTKTKGEAEMVHTCLHERWLGELFNLYKTLKRAPETLASDELTFPAFVAKRYALKIISKETYRNFKNLYERDHRSRC